MWSGGVEVSNSTPGGLYRRGTHLDGVGPLRLVFQRRLDLPPDILEGGTGGKPRQERGGVA